MQRPPRRGSRVVNPVQWQAPAAAAAQVAAAMPDAPERQRVIDDFEAALREDPGLTAEERDTILRSFKDALHNAPVQLGAPDVDELRASFVRVVQTMAEERFIEPSEQEGLMRQLFDAAKVLDSDEVRQSTEFARRIQQDGEAKALEWLAAQRKPSAPQQAAPQPSSMPGLGMPVRRRRR